MGGMGDGQPLPNQSPPDKRRRISQEPSSPGAIAHVSGGRGRFVAVPERAGVVLTARMASWRRIQEARTANEALSAEV